MKNTTAKAYGFTHATNQIFQNQTPQVLIDHAVKYTGATLTKQGALVITTGKHTGRAAKDKYVVVTPKSETTIDWKNNVNKATSETFAAIKADIINHINANERLYWSQRNVGANATYSLSTELFTTHPSHALFFDYLMRNDQFESYALGHYTIYHAPTLQVDSKKYNTRSETVIMMDIDNCEILIAGTLYAGEIKKSVFSAMNYILPEHGLLPMHAGSNVAKNGEVSVFFGLSGTGKTTLSTQESRLLIGDDEHAICNDGIFNFEGGCYAKTYKLSAEAEPDIFKACNTPGALLENVVLKADGTPDFDDKSISENGRCAYPLSFIGGVEKTSQGTMPKHMFFLSADAFGVLPPVSKLSKNQAMYYFLSGYTAKLAGTEMGVTEPQATFSTCFGAPFMMRNSKEYATLLGQYIDKHNIQVWLINTGWTGGAYGVGHRFPIKTTRRIIDAIQNGELENAEFVKESNFGLSVPAEIKGVDATLLRPERTWTEGDYTETAKKLGGMFNNNFVTFHSAINSDIITGGPTL
ncbi:MAG: phosphoenolpyruvate carboxykinase (ATP) [Bdellovibrionales bacterium]|nr:phosphoenolpyruvate carboxykinase (ATP) [Bdellovibrionales bacterium]